MHKKIATSCNYFFAVSVCNFCCCQGVYLFKMFYFEVLVCRPLWDSLCTSQRYFFQLVLQTMSILGVSGRSFDVRFFLYTCRQQKKFTRLTTYTVLVATSGPGPVSLSDRGSGEEQPNPSAMGAFGRYRVLKLLINRTSGTAQAIHRKKQLLRKGTV